MVRKKLLLKLEDYLIDKLIFIKEKCVQCHKDKLNASEYNCTFPMSKYKGKREPVSEFFVAYVNINEIDNCTIYGGFI